MIEQINKLVDFSEEGLNFDNFYVITFYKDDIRLQGYYSKNENLITTLMNVDYKIEKDNSTYVIFNKKGITFIFEKDLKKND